MADFVPKKSRLAIGGQGGPKWLANVEQMVVLNGIHAGGLPWAQNLSEKCTQWCQNGSKMAHFGPKCQAHTSRTNDGTQWNTCRRT